MLEKRREAVFRFYFFFFKINNTFFSLFRFWKIKTIFLYKICSENKFDNDSIYKAFRIIGHKTQKYIKLIS